ANNRRSRQHGAAGHLELPLLLALAGQAVEVFITGTEQHIAIGKVSAGGNLAFGLEGPALGADGGINTMKNAVLVTNVNGPVVEARRGLEGAALVFPFGAAVTQLESVQVLVQRTGVNRVAGYGNCPFNAFLDFDLPPNFQGGRKG